MNLNRFLCILASLIQFYFFLFGSQGDDTRIREIRRKFEQAKGAERIGYLIEASRFYFGSDLEEARRLSQEALEAAIQFGDSRIVADVFILEAQFYYAAKDYDQALKIALQARELYEKSRDPIGLFFSDYNAGRAYFRKSDFQKSALHFGNCMRSNEILLAHSKENLDIILKMAMIYRRFKDLSKARSYTDRGMSLAESQKDSMYLGMLQTQSGLIYFDSRDWPAALDAYKNASSSYLEAGDREVFEKSKHNIAMVYFQLGKYNDALDILLPLITYCRGNNIKDILLRSTSLIGDIYIQKKEPEKAEFYYQQCFPLAEELGEFEENWLYLDYANACYKRGMYKEAYEYYLKHVEIQNKIFSREKEKDIAALQEQLEAVERTRQIELLKHENKIKQLSRNISVGFSLVVLVIMIWIIKKYLYLFAFWKKQKYIGQYRILECIGSGGMGVVFRAHPLRDKDASVAVKILKDELMQSESYKKRFKREGMIIDRLDHPNILKVHERGDENGRLFIVMEYIQGKTLESIIAQKGKLPPAATLHIIIQISDALSQIHARSIIHRDLKPSNIMVMDKNGDPFFVKLLDFGLSKVSYHSRLTTSGGMMGTLGYLAPEQLTDRTFSTASDVYSLGIIFYEMLTGTFLFRDESLSSVFDRILEGKPVPPRNQADDVLDEVNDLVMLMLDKDPARRPDAQKVFETLGIYDNLS